jgi:hypothetical protein
MVADPTTLLNRFAEELPPSSRMRGTSEDRSKGARRGGWECEKVILKLEV